MSGILLEEHAREKLGKPPTWRAFRYECLPAHSPDTTHYAITGMVCLDKKNGSPNWQCPLDEKAEVIISVEEHEAWLVEWERKTGKCWRCTGTGKIIKRVSRIDGTEYRPCPECKGMGKAVTQDPK